MRLVDGGKVIFKNKGDNLTVKDIGYLWHGNGLKHPVLRLGEAEKLNFYSLLTHKPVKDKNNIMTGPECKNIELEHHFTDFKSNRKLKSHASSCLIGLHDESDSFESVLEKGKIVDISKGSDWAFLVKGMTMLKGNVRELRGIYLDKLKNGDEIIILDANLQNTGKVVYKTENKIIIKSLKPSKSKLLEKVESELDEEISYKNINHDFE